MKSNLLKSNRFSASEIAQMRLPGLPTSKAAVAARAEREAWHYVESTGLGGKRRLFLLPDEYVEAVSYQEKAAPPQSLNGPQPVPEAEKALLERISSSNISDSELIEQIVIGVENWLDKQGLRIDAKRKASLISLLFSYFRERGKMDEKKLEDLMKSVA